MGHKRHTKRRVGITRCHILALLLVGLGVTSTYLALTPIAERAGAASSFRELSPYEIQGDRFSNYDFSSEYYNRNNVDWPINLIFAHGGTVGRVKETLDDPLDYGKESIDPPGIDPVEYGASPMHARVNDGPQGSGGEWDEDAGRKTRKCQSKTEPSVFHYRVYAPPEVDHFVNQRWGNYVIASSHIDHNECPPIVSSGDDGGLTWAGRSERAERVVAYNSARDFENALIYPDKVWLRNYEPLDESTSHYWRSDGKATFIDVSGRK